jgi:hypothetical protein
MRNRKHWMALDVRFEDGWQSARPSTTLTLACHCRAGVDRRVWWRRGCLPAQ